ncbi:MAG: glycosyltransferase family 4 protein [bacterium]|nr:glycosyltransferase family 4 protein [bacterium]
MRVLLDGRPLQGTTGSRGVGHYVRDLASGLSATGGDVDVRLLVRSGVAPLDAPVALHEVSIPSGPAFLWGRVLGASWIRRAGCDLWHATFLAPPAVPRGFAWVSTIHDLIPLRHPDGFSRRTLAVFERSLRWNARAPRVVAVSRVTADLVARRFGVPSGRIAVVPPPVDVEPLCVPGPAGVAGIDRPYLLHLGGFDPLKGVDARLLPALAALRDGGTDLGLVLTGPQSVWRSRCERTARELGLGDAASFVGLLDDERRVAAIRGAAAVVIASDEEGFGLPVVEALAAGVPVVVGPAAAAAEAAGGLAEVAVDGTPAALAEAIRRATTEGHGPRPDERRAHARRFERRQIATEMREIYRELLERS